MRASERTVFEALRLWRHTKFREICAESGKTTPGAIALEAATTASLGEEPKVSSPKDVLKGLTRLIELKGVDENE